MMCFGNPVALPLIPFPSSEIEGQEQYRKKQSLRTGQLALPFVTINTTLLTYDPNSDVLFLQFRGSDSAQLCDQNSTQSMGATTTPISRDSADQSHLLHQRAT